MKGLITGATGFVGLHLVSFLTQKGIKVRALVRSKNKAVRTLPRHVEIAVGDITRPETLNGVESGITHVIHLAAEGHVSATSDEAYARFTEANVRGTLNIMNAFKGKLIKSFVHVSSTAAMGLVCKEGPVDETDQPRPVTPYQKSKLESETAALTSSLELGIPVVILRPCMIYGVGGKGEFYKIASLFRRGLFPRVGVGRNLTPLVHVADVVQAIYKAMFKGDAGEVYLIASERSIEMEELGRIINNAWNVRKPFLFVAIWLMYSIATTFEILGLLTNSAPIATRQNILNTVKDREFDISKAKSDFGYKPKVDLHDGILDTINWYRDN